MAIFLLSIMALQFSACNKCRNLDSTQSGAILSLYDFKSCYIYVNFDSSLIIDSDTAFSSYQASHFKNCNASLESVDFSKNIILGFKTKTNACNAAFHRSIDIDTVHKEYRYTVEMENCKGCGTELSSNNIVVAPKIPAGYALKLIGKEK